MKRPIESDYISLTAYTRALEEYCEGLAQPEQEPVAWGMPSAGGGFIVDCITPEEHARIEGGYTTPLYTTPPPCPTCNQWLEDKNEPND